MFFKTTNMKLHILCCNLILIPLINYSQKALTNENQLILENTPSNDIASFGNINAEKKNQMGTFQLIIANPDMQFSITDEFLKWVEENRLNDRDQTLQIEEYISINIFSLEKIASTDFQPVTTVIYSGKP